MRSPPPHLIPIETLLLAYRSGIFPMAEARGDPDVFWVEPRERAVIPLDQFHCSASLRKVIRQDRFRVTVDADFAQVIAACAASREDDTGSWISHRIEASYLALHRAGHAHSVECWLDGTLVGGLYGVAFDRVFCGESMFSRADNASKVALAWLVALMRRSGYVVLDCQFMTGHLSSLGAVELSQERYLEHVAAAAGEPAMRLPQAYASLLSASAAGDGSGAGAAVGRTAGAVVDPGPLLPSRTGSSSPGKLIAQSFTQTS